MEGLILDLTRVVEGVPFTLEELIVVEEPTVAVRPITGRRCIDCHKTKNCRYDGPRCYFCSRISLVDAEKAEFIKEAYAGPCVFCSRRVGKKHYDHINMFEKNGNIMSMIESSIDVIKDELSLCQLLCVPCHKKITAKEREYGFTAKKQELNRRLACGDDIEQARKELAEEYALIFEDVYANLRRGCGRFNDLSQRGGSLYQLINDVN